MVNLILVLTLASILSVLGAGIYINHQHKKGLVTVKLQNIKKFVLVILSANILTIVALIIAAVVTVLTKGNLFAAEPAAAAAAVATEGLAEAVRKGLGYLGMGLATGCAAIGAGIGVGIAGAAGIGAISEKPDMLGKSLIYIGLAEGVAIYGLLISFMIYAKIG